MKDRCQTAICSFTKMLITSLEWYRREINQQHSKEAQCVPIENKEKLFSTQDRCSSWCAFRNLWIKSSSSFWGYKLMLWARLSLFFNVSFVCSQRSSWYRTKPVQVAVGVNSIKAGMISAASNCLLMTWLRMLFRRLSQFKDRVRISLICFLCQPHMNHENLTAGHFSR